MSTPAILDADMATVARTLRTGFDWWLEELRGLVPARARRWLAPRPGVIAHFDGERLTLSRRGAGIPRGRGTMAVTLALPPGAALVRDVDLPALGQGDMRRLIDLDAERLLPFAASAAVVDFEPGAAIGDGRQRVAVAALPLRPAHAAIVAAKAADLEVRRLGILDNGSVRFDFLPALLRADGRPRAHPRRLWWGLVALAFVVNLAVFIGRDIEDLDQTAALVETHGQAAATARVLRARVIGEDSRRRTMLAKRHDDPLRVLAATSHALPDGVWVQRWSWDGAQLRLAGFKNGNTDVVATLRREPRFVAVRNAGVDIPAQSTAAQPFDVTVDLRPRIVTAPAAPALVTTTMVAAR